MVTRFLATTITVICLLSLTGCRVDSVGSGSSVVSSAGFCEKADNLNWVPGKNLCFAIKTLSPASGSTKTLVVALHGSLSRGGDADYIIRVARRAARYGAIGVAMARPGYTLDGRTSSGVATRDQHRDERYTADEISSIGVAVASLKKHHGAERVVMVGHSGGAIISAVILGGFAPLVDVAILVSSPFDIPDWLYSQGRKPFANAESPSDYLSLVPKSSKIFAFTGERDTNTRPELAQDYVNKARGMGIEAKFFMIERAGHGFNRIGRSGEFKKSLRQAIDSS